MSEQKSSIGAIVLLLTITAVSIIYSLILYIKREIKITYYAAQLLFIILVFSILALLFVRFYVEIKK